MRLPGLKILAIIMWLTAINASAQESDIMKISQQDSILSSMFSQFRNHDSSGNVNAAIQDLMGLSWIFCQNSKVKESMQAIQMAKARCEKIGDSLMLPTVMMISADNYKTLGAYGTAMEYYRRADNLFLKNGDFPNHIFARYCTAFCYENRYCEHHVKDDIDSAMSVMKSAYRYMDSASSIHRPTITLIVSRVLLSKAETIKNRQEARALCLEALEILEIGTQEAVANEGQAEYIPYLKINKMDAYTKLDSLEKAGQTLSDLFSSQLPNSQINILYQTMIRYYKRTGDYRNAYLYMQKLNKLRLVSFNAEEASKSHEYEARLDFEKMMKQYNDEMIQKERDFEILSKRNERINSILRTNTLIIGAILLILSINGIILRRINRRLEDSRNQILKQNEELQIRHDTIEAQRYEIEQQCKTLAEQTEQAAAFRYSMERSTQLARSIQDALMTSRDMVQDYIGEHFIYWKSVSKVSGDFYWIRKAGKYTYVIVADATGHGVPGALLCMLGISIMNDLCKEIDLESDETMPGDFLNMLKSRFTSILGIGKDQMSDSIDLALIKIDEQNRKITYSGANRPLLTVRDQKYTEYKPTKMCIGYNILDRGLYANTELEYQPGDMIYLYSDGFSDQFGGEDGRTKFGSRRFHELLSSVSYMPMSIQQSVIDAVMQAWTHNESNNINVEQIDDQLIMGIRMS